MGCMGAMALWALGRCLASRIAAIFADPSKDRKIVEMLSARQIPLVSRG